MNQIVLEDDKNIVLNNGYHPPLNAAFGVVIRDTGARHFIMSGKYIRDFTEACDYYVVSLYIGFTRKNCHLYRENVTIKEFIEQCLKNGMDVYQFSSPQEMLKWAIAK